MKLRLVLAVLFCCVVSLVKTDLISEEHRLHDYLLTETRYNKFQRPVLNHSEKVNIRFGIALIQLYELDERTEHITAHFWIRQLWRDEYLTWNPDDFGGLTTLRVPADAVWKPDLKLYNGVNELKPHEVLAVVYNSGDVLHIPAATIVAMCPLDLSKFPFDEQTCVFKFGSWAYDGFKIDLDLYEGQKEIDLSDHVGSKEWDVVDTSAKILRKYYPCCEEPYPEMRFNLTIRRKTTYYHYVFMTPAVMLALLCPVLFVLPSDDTGKFSFGGTLLVTMAVLYMVLADQLPPTHNNVPVIGVYYGVVFVLTSLSLAVSAVTNNMANRATRFTHPPAFLKTIVLSCLGRVVCVSYDSTYGVGTSNVALQESPSDKQDGVQSTQITEWKLIARVLDRIFLILFLIVIVLTTLVLLA